MELKRIRDDRPLRLQRPVELLAAGAGEAACGVSVYFLSQDEFEEFVKAHEAPQDATKEEKEAASKALDEAVFSHIVASLSNVTPGNLVRLCPYYLQRHDEVLDLPYGPMDSTPENIKLLLAHLKPTHRAAILNAAMDDEAFAEQVLSLKKKSRCGQGTKQAPTPLSQVSQSAPQTDSPIAPASTQTTTNSGTATASAVVTSSS